MINGLLHDHISSFMARHRVPAGLRLVVLRADGLLIWDARKDEQSQALAALASGVWEASKAMAQAARQLKTQDFRLVFDSTDRGVLIFPTEGGDFHVAAIYEGCVNPALLKRQVQALVQKLSRHIAERPRPVAPVRPAPTPSTSKRDGFLFSDISDDEMDRLFGI